VSLPVLCDDARRELLAIVRRVLEQGPAGSRERQPATLLAELTAPGAAFVTLRRRRDGELRGCVGYVRPRHSLAETVARAAAAAAFDDSRFEPVAAGELSALEVEISVLGPPRPAQPDEVEVGRHGLIIDCDGQSGLLLPQVAPEHGWDRLALLEQICRKAGLPAGSWRAPGCQLQVFEALVFGEA
jgi:uncharacterized protein